MLLKGNVLGAIGRQWKAERTRNMRSTWTKLEGVAARTQRLQPWHYGETRFRAVKRYAESSERSKTVYSP